MSTLGATSSGAGDGGKRPTRRGKKRKLTKTKTLRMYFFPHYAPIIIRNASFKTQNLLYSNPYFFSFQGRDADVPTLIKSSYGVFLVTTVEMRMQSLKI